MKGTQVNAYHTVLSMSIDGLRLCGIWGLNTSTSIYIKLIHLLSGIIGIIALMLLITTIAADLLYNLDDLLIITDNGCYLAGLSVILFKIYKFHNQRNQIQNLTKAIYTPIRNLQRSTDAEISNILRANTFYENIGFTFFSSMGAILMIALIFFVPRKDGELPMRAAYPIDITTPPTFQLAFVAQLYAVAYGVAAILLMDTIGLGFMRWINVQLIILSHNYRNCEPKSFQENDGHSNTFINSAQLLENRRKSKISMDINGDPKITSTIVLFPTSELDNVHKDFVSRFKQCVMNHQRLIGIVEDINNIFSTSMLMQLFASFTMICLTGFQAVLGVEEKSSLMKFVIYLGAALTQLLYWCWYGNELFYQTQSLLIAQWMSGWENQLNSASKILIVMSMSRTMQPLELKAGVFFTMSMETFIAVISIEFLPHAFLHIIIFDMEH
uniref:Odorant receptor n=1 Tax=Meteorus pulchricornis TaxID=51522 RepID=A0A1S5VFN0_9HYME|nr:olfactory receptor 43 [Meteorus pulchricornis]